MRYADRGDFSASVDSSLRTLRNSSYHTKAEFSNCLIFIQYISLTSLKHPYLLLDFCENFCLFLQLVVIKRFFPLQIFLKKGDFIYQAIFFAYSCVCSVQF